MATTPRRLQAAFWLVAVTAILFAILADWVIADTRQMIQTLGFDAVPSIVAAQQIRARLSDMDTKSGDLLLAGETDTQPSWRSFLDDEATLANQIVIASQNITYPEEKAALSTLTDGIQDYQRLIGEAREAGPLTGIGTLIKASDMLRLTLLPAAVRLNDVNFSVLDQEYDRHQRGVLLELATFGGVSLAFLAVLLGLQFDLARRTRRTLNLPILAATILAGLAIAWEGYGLTAAASDLRAAKQDSFDSIHALWKARATAYDATSDETYYLLAAYHPSRGGTYDPLDPRHTPEENAAAEQRDAAQKAAEVRLMKGYEAEFQRKAALIAAASPVELEHALHAYGDAPEIGAMVENGLHDFTIADYRRLAFPFPAKQNIVIAGLLGDELRNITYPGEAQAAIAAGLLWKRYLELDQQIRGYATSGRVALAIDLDTSTNYGGAGWMFSRFDRQLGVLIQINDDAFRQQTADAAEAMKGQIWGAPLAGLLVVVLTWLGLQPRINEYKD